MIDGDVDFLTQNSSENWTGAGTAGDPLLIANYNITASGAHGISILNTRLYFKIVNCSLNGATGGVNAGIYLYNVTNSVITNNLAINNDYGIYLEYSANNTLTNNTATSNHPHPELLMEWPSQAPL